MSAAPTDVIREVLTRDGAEPPPFKFLPAADGWAICGEIDFASTPLLALALRASVATPWVLDVSLLDFIDVAGMRAIATAAVDAGSTLELRQASPQLRRLWTLAGFDRAAPEVRFVD